MADEAEILAAAPHLLAMLQDLAAPNATGDGLVSNACAQAFIDVSGNLPRFPRVVYGILEQAEKLPGWNQELLIYLKEALALHDDKTFAEATRGGMKSWIQSFKVVQFPMPVSLLPPPQQQQQRGGAASTSSGLVTSKATHQYRFPRFRGQEGEAQHFVDVMTETLSAASIPPLQWYSYLQNNVSDSAQKLIMQNKRRFGTDYDKHCKALIAHFDVGEVRDRAENYVNSLRQMNNETALMFKIRFQDEYDKMASEGKKPKHDDADYDDVIKTDFWFKLTKHYRNILTDKICDKLGTMSANDDPLKLCTYDQLLHECGRLDNRLAKKRPDHGKKKKKHHDHTNTDKSEDKPVSMPNVPRGPKPQKCYYCGSTAHRYEKRRRPNGSQYFYCPEKQAGREPCQEYKDWIQQKKGRPWTPRPSGGGRAPASTPPAPPSQPTATVLSEDKLVRKTAITTDVRLRTAAGTFTPADMFETLVDSCGCENLVDDEWAREILRLPVQTDNSDQANIPSTGLAGSKAYFKQYVNVDALCGATPVKMRFYLSTKLPRPLLLGNPFLSQQGALIDLDEGVVTMKRLKTTTGAPTVIKLKEFGHSAASAVNMICTFVPAPSAYMPTSAMPTYVPPVPPTMPAHVLPEYIPMHASHDHISYIPKDPEGQTAISYVAPLDEYFFSFPIISTEDTIVEPRPSPPPDSTATMGDVEVSNWDDYNFGTTVFQLTPDDLTTGDFDLPTLAFMTPMCDVSVAPGDMIPSCFDLPTSITMPAAPAHNDGLDVPADEFDAGLQKLVEEYADIFDMSKPNISNYPEVHLGLKPEYRGRFWRRGESRKSPLVQKSCDIDGQKILDAGYGFLNPHSPNNIPRVRVARKDKDGNPLDISRDRWCLDLRMLNACLEDFDHPLPNLQDVIEGMTRSKVFSELDLKEAFNSLRINRELSDLFTFTTSQGKISYKVMPYGVKWGSSIFQWNMEEGFREFLETILFLYIDNLIVHTESLSTHLIALRNIFQRCRELNLKLRLEKCAFAKTVIRTMGFIVQHGSLKPDPIKIDMIRSAPVPTDASALRRFLGLMQFYRSMMAQLSMVAQPLYKLTSSTVPFIWTETHQKAFELLKTLMSEDTLRRSLVGDDDIVVYTDASKFAICVVVTQKNQLIHAASKILQDNEANWHIIEKEALAISWGLNKMDYYLLGRKFVLLSDHKPLLAIFRNLTSVSNARLLQCALSVAEFTFVLKYLEGKRNVLADFGSRDLDPKLWHDDEDEKCKLENLRGVPHFILSQNDVSAILPYTMTFSESSSAMMMNANESSNSRDEILQKPKIKNHHYRAEDYAQIQKNNLVYRSEGEVIVVTVNEDDFVFVPLCLRRSFFWYLHFPRHESLNNIYYRMKSLKLFYPKMKEAISDFLSSCACSNQKNQPPRKLITSREEETCFWAAKPLDILCIDLYEYAARNYLTMIDVFSRYAFAFEVYDKTAGEVARVFYNFVSMFAVPLRVLCDNGPEFARITVDKVPSPVYSPQSNGLVERLHKEIGNHCRINDVDPTVAVAYTRTPEKRLLFFSYLKYKFNENPVSMVTSKQVALRSFPVHSLVWHLVHSRSRKKSDPTFSGPHRVMQKISDTVYLLSSSKNSSPTKFFKAHLNNLKKCVLPSTVGWMLKDEYFQSACDELGSDNKLPVFLSYDNLCEDVLDIMTHKQKYTASYLVLPEIPCLPWYPIIFGQMIHLRVELPYVPDLILDASGSPVGLLPWRHHLVLIQA